MANFLQYSDYKRFIEELAGVRELYTVASLMRDFAANFVKANPNFYDSFLDALWTIYPDYDLDCEEELLLEYNEDNFKDYPNPRLEFVGQYLHYLSANSYDGGDLPRLKRVPYDFSEEAEYVIDKDAIYRLAEDAEGVNPGIKTEKPYTFNIRELHKTNIEKLIEKIHEDVTISGDNRMAQKLANILTCNDLATLSEDERTVHVVCKTNFFVFLLDEIRIAFRGTLNARILEKALFYTNTGNPLTINNVYASRSRNNDLPPDESDIVKEAVKRYSPKN